MGATNISWAHYTFNPWIGCEAVSEGCAHCYARRDFGRKPRWADCWGNPRTTVRRRTSAANWRKPLAWNQRAAQTGQRCRVFCASLADVFEDAPGLDAWRADLWQLIDQTPNLDWLLLTKRVAAAVRFAPTSWPRNAWFGFTAENQEMLAARAPLALELKAALRIPVLFVSLEPLLGPVDFKAVPYTALGGHSGYANALTSPLHLARLDWVIAGGESGPAARPLHPDRVRAVRDQCVAAHVPFHFKQWGEWVDGQNVPEAHLDAALDCAGDPQRDYRYMGPVGEVQLFRVGHQRAGHLLDGQEWQQFPEVANG